MSSIYSALNATLKLAILPCATVLDKAEDYTKYLHLPHVFPG